MKAVAIFGAKGYLGSQLQYYYEQKGVFCDGFDMPECNVIDPLFWQGFRPMKYDAVLYFAGLTGTERGFQEPTEYVSVNEIGLLHLLNILAPFGEVAPRVVFPSSRLVYKGVEKPLSEEDEKEAKTVYAVNKLACEYFLEAYHNRFGVPYSVVRICVPYGSLISSDYSYGTVGFFVKQAAAGQITLYGDGSLRRTFTHVADICEVVFRLAESLHPGVFNIGGEDLTLLEAANLIASAKGANVKFVPWPSVAELLESGSTYFSSEKLAREIGDFDYQLFSELVKEL